MSEVYLAHHGVKGQKWGIRRYQENRNQRIADYRTKKAYKNARMKIKKGSDPSKYSDIRRKQLLTAAEKYVLNESSRSRAHANIDSGKNVLLSYAKAYLGTGVKDITKTVAAQVGAYMLTGDEQFAKRVGDITYGTIKAGRFGRAVGQYIHEPKYDARMEKMINPKSSSSTTKSKTTSNIEARAKAYKAASKAYGESIRGDAAANMKKRYGL